MLNKGFLKPILTIDSLGKMQFWTGIFIGILSSFVLSYFFNYSREFLRTFTFLSDFFILTEKQFRIYDLFFSTFSTSLGFGFTFIYWLSDRGINVKKKYLINFASSSAWLITFTAIMVVVRFGSLLPFFMYREGYDNHFDLLNDFWFLFLLIPIYVFLAQWNAVRLIFRTRYWIYLSFFFFLITSFYLYKTTFVDRDVLNQKYYLKNKYRFDYIDNEFQNARKLGIFFNDTTKEILRKKHAKSTTDLVYKLKKAFQTEDKVPLDTLILEKIVIHNMNRHELYFHGYLPDKDKNWPYALPENIYYQIIKNDFDNNETKILFEILTEQIQLLIAPEINWKEEKKYTDYEKKKSLFRRNIMYTTITIQSRLIQVVEKLKSDKQYEKYHYLLPDIQFDNFYGIQKYYKINLTGANRVGSR